MRVYLPSSLETLAACAAAGIAVRGPATAHAVTRTLRDFYVDADPRDLEEELEYVAMTDAAQQSLHVLAVTARPRRVVLALDVDETLVVTPASAGWAAPERSSVTVTGDVGLDALASIHVDDAVAIEDVRAAVAALPAAEAGDAAAQELVEECEAHELLWYDAGELTLLLAAGD